jgi:TusA-related sulfurtransferase
MEGNEDQPIVDIRGETCGMPLVRVEKFLRERRERSPFTVLGDVPQTMESLPFLAARHGWRCEVERGPSGDWKARFLPAER